MYFKQHKHKLRAIQGHTKSKKDIRRDILGYTSLRAPLGALIVREDYLEYTASWIEQKGMAFDHDFGYSYTLCSYLLKKEGRKKRRMNSKVYSRTYRKGKKDKCFNVLKHAASPNTCLYFTKLMF